ncbi:MAG: PepSY domain-containing protein [bacterium]
MSRILTIAAMGLSLAVPAYADTTATPAAAVTCSTAPTSAFKPQADLIALLKTQGLTVVKIKTESGCYEAYTKDANGKKATLGFNAETLEPVANAEAGEG